METCPKCGYCPTCGRANQPNPFQTIQSPLIQAQPNYQGLQGIGQQTTGLATFGQFLKADD